MVRTSLVTIMMVSIHLLSSMLFVACIVSLACGAVVFVHNLQRKDPEYESRFAWWTRLLLYLVAFAIPPVGLLFRPICVREESRTCQIREGVSACFADPFSLLYWNVP